MKSNGGKCDVVKEKGVEEEETIDLSSFFSPSICLIRP
jgi:hypothetical protein